MKSFKNNIPKINSAAFSSALTHGTGYFKYHWNKNYLRMTWPKDQNPKDIFDTINVKQKIGKKEYRSYKDWYKANKNDTYDYAKLVLSIGIGVGGLFVMTSGDTSKRI